MIVLPEPEATDRDVAASQDENARSDVLLLGAVAIESHLIGSGTLERQTVLVANGQILLVAPGLNDDRPRLPEPRRWPAESLRSRSRWRRP